VPSGGASFISFQATEAIPSFPPLGRAGISSDRIVLIPVSHVLKLWDVSASATMSRKVSFQMLLIKRKSLYDYTENHKHWLMISYRRRRLNCLSRMVVEDASNEGKITTRAELSRQYLGTYCSIRATVRLRREPIRSPWTASSNRTNKQTNFWIAYLHGCRTAYTRQRRHTKLGQVAELAQFDPDG